MRGMVLLRVVRVNGVGHISREKEAVVDGAVVVFLGSSEVLEDPFSDFRSHLAVSTLG